MLAKSAIFAVLFVVSVVSGASLPVRSRSDGVRPFTPIELGPGPVVFPPKRDAVWPQIRDSVSYDEAYRNALLQLQYYASNPIRQLQAEGNTNAVNTILTDVQDLAVQIANGAISLDQAYNTTSQDINNVLQSNTANKRNTALDQAFDRIQPVASSVVSVLNADGKTDVANNLVSQLQNLYYQAGNGTIRIDVAYNDAVEDIAYALRSDN